MTTKIKSKTVPASNKSYLYQRNGHVSIPVYVASRLGLVPGVTRLNFDIDEVQGSLIVSKAK